MRTKTARISFALFCVTSILLTALLGVWQVQRLSWKEKLLNTLEANHNKPRALLEDVLQKQKGRSLPETLEGRRVILVGSYGKSPPFFLVNQWKEQTLGVRPVQVFNTRGGYRLYVVGTFQSIKTVPHDPSHQQNSKAEIRLEGILRQASRQKGFGTIPNDLEKRELIRVDPSALGTWDRETSVATSFYVDTNTSFYEARRVIPNNHLGYAITWFLLSFCLLLFALYHWRRFP